MRIALAALLMACVGCSTIGSSARDRTDQASEDVRAATDRFLVAFGNLDWEAFRATWSSSPTAFFPFSDIPARASGRAEVERQFQALFDEARASMPGPPYFKFQPEQLQVQSFGDSALVTFMVKKEGRLSRRTLFFVREGGEWKLAHLHASDIDL